MSHQQIAKVMVVMPNEMRNAVAISFARSQQDNLPDMEHLGLPCIAVKRGGVHASSVLAYAGFRVLG
jgi:hypothetical protein